jgi:hypothetical protein
MDRREGGGGKGLRNEELHKLCSRKAGHRGIEGNIPLKVQDVDGWILIIWVFGIWDWMV